MKKYKSEDRRAWLKHCQESGNIAATCRHFGISRATFYKWFGRYDPDQPSKPLLSRKRLRKTSPSTRWNGDDLNILAELDNQTGARLGAGRLAEQLHQRYDTQLSRATVGRMLAKIRKRCPMCGDRNSHNKDTHTVKRMLLDYALWHSDDPNDRLHLSEDPNNVRRLAAIIHGMRNLHPRRAS